MDYQDFKILKKAVGKLREGAEELRYLIDDKNDALNKGIGATDAQPPDYYDHQTVHEMVVLAEQINSHAETYRKNK